MHFITGLHTAVASKDASEVQPGQLLHLEQLPLRCVKHLSETKVVGAGFDGEVCSGFPPEEIPLRTQLCL